MSDILNTLKNLIFEEDKKNDNKEQTLEQFDYPLQEPSKISQPTEHDIPISEVVSEIAPATESESAGIVETTDEVVQKFCQELKDIANNAGTEYAQFQNMLNSLRVVIPDEKTLYKSTEIAVINTGITIEQVIDAVNNRINTLFGEEKKFEKQLKKQIFGIEEKQKKCEDIDSQIEIFKKEIEQLESNKETIRNEINAMKNQIDSDRANFGKAVKIVAGELEQDKQKIEDYLCKESKKMSDNSSK